MKEIDIKTALNILEEDDKKITYRPKWNAFTKNITATVVLQQIFFWWKNNGKKPFYKFRTPCEHPAYNDGDSWTEELNISLKSFNTALSKIGVKLKKGDENNDMPVEYWITMDRMTYWQINERVFTDKILSLYGELPKELTGDYVSDQKAITYMPKGNLDITENTTENTTEKKKNNKKEVFKKPSIEQIREYMRTYALQKQELHNCIEQSEAFFDHYTANGWKVSGKTPMKDWKASVRTWLRNAKKFGNNTSSKTNNTQYWSATL